MEESILKSIRSMLVSGEDDNSFDLDLIMHINTTLDTLNQAGVGVEGFHISGDTETWDQFINREDIESVKTYVYLSVKNIFDPPTNSFLIEHYKSVMNELLWRLNINTEHVEDEL